MQVSAFVRRTNAGGDFATVLQKGDATSGAIILIGLVRGANPRVFERFPSLDGRTAWQSIQSTEPLTPEQVSELVEKRTRRDPDLWIIELDAADDERLSGLLASGD